MKTLQDLNHGKVIYVNRFKRQPHNMIKHTQTIKGINL